MIARTIISDAANAIGRLDFSEANARLAEIDAEMARCESAIVNARGRVQEIGQTLNSRGTLREQVGGRASAVAVADRLLADVAPREAAGAFEDDAKLAAEREALQAGIVELRSRTRALETEARAIKDAAKVIASEPLHPVLAALHDRAMEIAAQLARVHLAVAAISTATRANPAALRATRPAFDGLTVDHGLVRREIMPPPAEISELLAQYVDMGPAVNIRPMPGYDPRPMPT